MHLKDSLLQIEVKLIDDQNVVYFARKAVMKIITCLFLIFTK